MLQRFISEDPIWFAGGLNTYGYALSNPITYTDSRGLSVGLALLCELFAAGSSFKSWTDALNPPDQSLLDDQLDRIDERINDCGNANDSETIMKKEQLRLIHNELSKAKLDLAKEHAINNVSNASLIGITQFVVQSGICRLLLVASPL